MRSGGGFGLLRTPMTGATSDSASGCPGNSDAVCPSGPMPSRIDVEHRALAHRSDDVAAVEPRGVLRRAGRRGRGADAGRPARAAGPAALSRSIRVLDSWSSSGTQRSSPSHRCTPAPAALHVGEQLVRAPWRRPAGQRDVDVGGPRARVVDVVGHHVGRAPGDGLVVRRDGDDRSVAHDAPPSCRPVPGSCRTVSGACVVASSESARMTCMTALMSARCVNACGKFPRWRPERGSISSA